MLYHYRAQPLNYLKIGCHLKQFCGPPCPSYILQYFTMSSWLVIIDIGLPNYSSFQQKMYGLNCLETKVSAKHLFRTYLIRVCISKLNFKLKYNCIACGTWHSQTEQSGSTNFNIESKGMTPTYSCWAFRPESQTSASTKQSLRPKKACTLGLI